MLMKSKFLHLCSTKAAYGILNIVLWDIRMLQQCLWVEVNITFQDWIQLKIRIPLVSERPLSPFPVTVISKKVKHLSLLLKLHIHLHITVILKVPNQIKLCIKNVFITCLYQSYPPSYFCRNTFLPVVIENKNR